DLFGTPWTRTVDMGANSSLVRTAHYVVTTLPLPAGRCQAGGPLVSCTVALWWRPDWSTQPTFTLSPTWYGLMAELRELAESTVFPPNDTMTSPAPSPADSAGLPDSTPWIRAPELTGACPPEPPKPPPKGSEPDRPPALLTSTPRNGRPPTCTFPPPWPASICLAMVRALLIGMAKPTFDDELDEDSDEPLVAAAVVMPIT